MEFANKPDLSLAKKVLPAPLLQALLHIFGQRVKGCMLVGGTALAGFYAGHRRSDDLDLFVQDETSYQATTLAAHSLVGIGATLTIQMNSAQYFRALCKLSHHVFTIDVVLDSNLFQVGSSSLVGSTIEVADLHTICMMKAATLVSRCSEKDLYDLHWISRTAGGLKIKDLLSLGQRIDGGVNPESLLISVDGALLSENSCGFCRELGISPAKVFKVVKDFKEYLLEELMNAAEQIPPPPIKSLVDQAVKLGKARPRS